MLSDQESSNRTFRIVSWTLAAVFVCQCAIMIAYQTHLYNDGGHYLYSLMRDPRPMSWDFSRRFAQLITQVPVLVGIHTGVTDVPVLSGLLGVGLYLPHVAGLVACLWIARDRPEAMIIPLLSAVAITSSADFFIISESHQLLALFWPLVLLLALHDSWSKRELMLAVLFALPTLCAYESMVILGPVLIALAGWRALSAHRSGDPSARNWFLAFAAYFAAGVAIGLWFIINPRNVPNLENFLDAIRFYRDDEGHWHLPALLSIAGIMLVAVYLFVPRLAGRIGVGPLIAFGVASFVCALSPWLWPASVVPALHARARTLNAFLPPVLALLLVVMLMRPPSSRQLRYAFAVVALLATGQGVWHVLAGRQWARYLDLFESEVATREGLVPFQSTALAIDVKDGNAVAAMNTTWTMPEMSILLSPNGQVKSMIFDPTRKKGWQPFDPARPEQLGDLSRYGIDYDAYRSALGDR